MSYQAVVARVFLSLFFLLPMVGCGGNDRNEVQKDPSNETAGAQATAGDSLVMFDVSVEGCMCTDYDYFLVRWSGSDNAFVNVAGLESVLRYGDENGLLLCDCHEGDGVGLKSMIKEIVALEDGPGLRINLVQKVYLDGDQVIPKVSKLFQQYQYYFVIGSKVPFVRIAGARKI